nr:hypothetical protein [Tanacetum cinerariifolium]
RYLIPAEPPIHNHVLIPNYQDFKVQDFRYSDGFECFQAINIGRYEHAGPDPGDAKARVQSISSHVVHAGSDREHMDLDVADVLPQPSTEQLD